MMQKLFGGMVVKSSFLVFAVRFACLRRNHRFRVSGVSGALASRGHTLPFALQDVAGSASPVAYWFAEEWSAMSPVFLQVA
jgi:hypothetical protein